MVCYTPIRTGPPPTTLAAHDALPERLDRSRLPLAAGSHPPAPLDV